MAQQFRQIPVKVYKSTDAGAPVIQSGILGGIINVLRACLVDGYGGKQGLGWEIPFADTNKITFRSTDPTSNKDFLYVNATNPKNIEAKGYRNMTSISNGTGMFNYPSQSYINVSHKDNGSKTSWFLVGHEKAFILAMFNDSGVGANTAGGSYLYFGDVPSFVGGDNGNTIISAEWHHSNYWWGESTASVGGIYPVFAQKLGSLVPQTSEMSYLSCSYTQQQYDILSQPSDIINIIITNSASQIYLCNDGYHRAVMGGIYYTPCKCTMDKILQNNFVYPMKGFDKYLYAMSYYTMRGAGFLVDTVSWTGV